MNKLISAVSLFLMTCCAWAGSMEDAANAPPAEGVSMLYVVLFLVLFLGGIVAFFIYMWWLDKQKKAKGDHQ
jgi:TRAP-type C4-dicarboxylate transport system permease small subunit